MEKIIIVDYGSQYTRLIARRIRENHVFSRVISPEEAISDFEDVKGIIFSGGPDSVYDAETTGIPEWFRTIKGKIPVLGICYGFQLLVYALKGVVEHTGSSEYGRTSVKLINDLPLFKGCGQTFTTWMSHGDSVVKLPAGFRQTSCSYSTGDSLQNAAYESSRHDGLIVSSADNSAEKIYGLQFHPEVNHTEFGETIISNFLFEICECKASWKLEDFVERQIIEIRDMLKDSKVISGFSGGVDSSVASVLVHEAVGDNLTNIFVDHGLLRKDEEKEVPAVFKKALGLRFKLIDARDEFLGKLNGVSDPEEKRRIIGETFIRVFEREAMNVKNTDFLVQGTIYS